MIQGCAYDKPREDSVKRYGVLRRLGNGSSVLVGEIEDWDEATTIIWELSGRTSVVHLIYDFNVGAVVATSSGHMASMVDSLVAQTSAPSR